MSRFDAMHVFLLYLSEALGRTIELVSDTQMFVCGHGQHSLDVLFSSVDVWGICKPVVHGQYGVI